MGDIVIHQDLSAFVAQIDSATSFGDLNAVLTRTRTAMGFNHYLFIQLNNSQTDSGIMLQDYPESWVELQRETMGFLRSPIVKAASQQATPFRWSELDQLLQLTDLQRDYLRIAEAHGLADAYTIPFHAPGRATALFNFVNGPNVSLNEAMLPAAMFVASRSFVAANRIHSASPLSESQLSKQDKQVVVLVCRGQGKARIASTLNIEPKDVSAAIARACRYYRAGSQTEMVVQALWHQCIKFEDVIR
jgi:DNA-binding CsgD family transcriptional regulator